MPDTGSLLDRLPPIDLPGSLQSVEKDDSTIQLAIILAITLLAFSLIIESINWKDLLVFFATTGLFAYLFIYHLDGGSNEENEVKGGYAPSKKEN